MKPSAFRGVRRGPCPAALAILLLARAASAQEPTLPIHPEEAVLALMRILERDENLQLRDGGELVVIAVPYEKGQEEARDDLLRVCRTIARSHLFRKKKGLHHVPVLLRPADTAAAFKAALVEMKASAVLVPAGLTIPARDAVAQAANEEKLHTLAMDPTQVDRWFTVAVEPAPGKMQVVINADNVRNAAGWFDPGLLKVSRILHANPKRKKARGPPAAPAKEAPREK